MYDHPSHAAVSLSQVSPVPVILATPFSSSLFAFHISHHATSLQPSTHPCTYTQYTLTHTHTHTHTYTLTHTHSHTHSQTHAHTHAHTKYTLTHTHKAHARTTAQAGLPLRPTQSVCPFYLKKADCKYKEACKYHHPPLKPVWAGEAVGNK